MKASHIERMNKIYFHAKILSFILIIFNLLSELVLKCSQFDPLCKFDQMIEHQNFAEKSFSGYPCIIKSLTIKSGLSTLLFLEAIIKSNKSDNIQHQEWVLVKQE